MAVTDQKLINFVLEKIRTNSYTTRISVAKIVRDYLKEKSPLSDPDHFQNRMYAIRSTHKGSLEKFPFNAVVQFMFITGGHVNDEFLQTLEQQGKVTLDDKNHIVNYLSNDGLLNLGNNNENNIDEENSKKHEEEEAIEVVRGAEEETKATIDLPVEKKKDSEVISCERIMDMLMNFVRTLDSPFFGTIQRKMQCIANTYKGSDQTISMNHLINSLEKVFDRVTLNSTITANKVDNFLVKDFIMLLDASLNITSHDLFVFKSRCRTSAAELSGQELRVPNTIIHQIFETLIGKLPKSVKDSPSTQKAKSVPPGDIQTQPASKIVFNAPYDVKNTVHIKVINSSARRIGYGIKTINMIRLGVDPPCGVLDPKEAVFLAVSCDDFAYGEEDTNNDRITVEWTNTPDGAAKQFRREWFQGDGMVRRKDLRIKYNS